MIWQWNLRLVFGLVLCFLCLKQWLGYTDKDRELSEGQAEIKALRLSERQREKAVEEVYALTL